MHFFSAFTAGGAVCSLAVAWSMIHCTVPSSKRGKGFWCRRRWQPSVGFCTLCMVTAGYGFSWHNKDSFFSATRKSCIILQAHRSSSQQPVLLSSPQDLTVLRAGCQLTVPSHSALRSHRDSKLSTGQRAKSPQELRAGMAKGTQGQTTWRAAAPGQGK